MDGHGRDLPNDLPTVNEMAARVSGVICCRRIQNKLCTKALAYRAHSGRIRWKWVYFCAEFADFLQLPRNLLDTVYQEICVYISVDTNAIHDSRWIHAP